MATLNIITSTSFVHSDASLDPLGFTLQVLLVNDPPANAGDARDGFDPWVW